jgi:uncharacterized membrane protein
MIHSSFIVAAVIGASVAEAAAVEVCRYEATVIRFPNPQWVVTGRGINDKSEVCGSYYFIDPTSDTRPFFWSAARGIVYLPLPPGFIAGWANAIADNGDIVGAGRPDECCSSALLWRDGQVFDLGLLPDANNSEALALAGEVIVGWSGSTSGGPLDPFEAVRWDNGVLHPIVIPFGEASQVFDVGDDQHMCGWMAETYLFDSHAFVQGGNKAIADLGVIPGGFSGIAGALNSTLDVALWGFITVDAQITKHAFLFSDGRHTNLGAIRNFNGTIARDMNDGREIVGDCQFNNGADAGFIWQNGRIRSVGLLVNGFDDVAQALAINSAGQITGHARLNGRLVVLNPVPGSPADLTGDCRADIFDLVELFNLWGSDDYFADYDGNGTVNVLDLLYLLAHWG